jgi:hypothetical protein
MARAFVEPGQNCPFARRHLLASARHLANER